MHNSVPKRSNISFWLICPFLCKAAGYFPYVFFWFLYGILHRNVKCCKTYAGVPHAAGINFRPKGLVSLPTTLTFEGSCVMRYQAVSIGQVADISLDVVISKRRPLFINRKSVTSLKTPICSNTAVRTSIFPSVILFVITPNLT